MNILITISIVIAVITSVEQKPLTKPQVVPVISKAKQTKVQPGLFTIVVSKDKKMISIKPPKLSKFELPDSTAEIIVFKNVDFNADGKKDLMLSLGACGTGGCMYGLFLKQHDNQYSLAFMDYLKNAEFKKDKKGFLVIKSSEEIEAYNPSKLQVTVFKYHAQKQYYKLDTTYVFIDK